ncbi:MAG: hypothetical protein RLZZ383_1334 [Pseudomonadota bacterium]|jgi:23S rRNA (uracil1939-C5)-methyltransferase
MQVEMTELDVEGHSRGRHEGRWVRVRGALPGEIWAFHDVAPPVRIRPSPDAVVPSCPVAASCGGCDLAALAPARRAQALTQLVQNVLALPALPTWHSDPRAGRARIQLHVHDGRLSYRAAGTHRPVAVVDCEIADAAIRAVLPVLGDAVAEDVADGARLEVRTNGSRVVFDLQGEGWAEPARRRIAKLGAVSADGRAIAGEPTLDLEVAGSALRASPGAFFQVHAALNEVMVATVVAAADDVASERALDLFAGIGNFTIPLAARGRPVHAVELAGVSVRDLKATVRRLGLAHVTVEAADATAYDPRRQPFDFAIVDPPRAGAGNVLDRLAVQRPKRIALVNCDLSAARHDHQRLRKAGYQPSTVHAFDLFPQTHHIEVLAIFDRGR